MSNFRLACEREGKSVFFDSGLRKVVLFIEVKFSCSDFLMAKHTKKLIITVFKYTYIDFFFVFLWFNIFFVILEFVIIVVTALLAKASA